ncbi:MAG: polysaccharide deacetylase family protein [Candidatus Omnitrophica bacterium]|nr:polysaccharide deacetylase family protein [Candidatus Omnitrophota bacterium]
MICLTGDIHHTSLGTNDQRYIGKNDTEVKISCRFLELIEKHNVKTTFYITGRSFNADWQDLESITSSSLVEVGGHTYSGIPSGNLDRLKSRLLNRCPSSHGARYGSPSSQGKDIKRMVEAVREKSGYTIVSWRSHGLVYDRHTYSLLRQNGIRLISDEISAKKIFPEKTKEGLISHPINVIPDHDHLYHAHRDEEFVKKAKSVGYGTDAFGAESYPVEVWGDRVLERVAEIEKAGGLATILMHPVCMYLADRFRTAERLLKHFAGYKNIWAREILPLYEVIDGTG